MGKGREDGMVSHSENDNGFCPGFSGVITGYLGHLLGIVPGQMMTCSN
jgi:hypothetical protein